MIRSNKTDFRASKTMIPIAKKTPRTMVFPSPDAADSQDKQSWQSVLSAGLFILILTLCLIGGFVLEILAAPTVHNHLFPWLIGRSFGLAAFLALVALVALGMWISHPWRLTHAGILHPASLLRAHVALAITVTVLTVGHIVSLASDRYAGVGWVAVFVPGLAHYRTAAVSLGTIGLYCGILSGVTATLAGSLAQKVWLPVHRLAALSFLFVWFHAVIAGSDTPMLRSLYALTALVLLGLGVSRYLVPIPVEP